MPSTSLLNVNDEPAGLCPRCGGNGLVHCETTTTIWREGRPYVIEQIPALRCEACSEVLIDHETADILRQVARDLPHGYMALRTIEVPVISFPACL